ncbi:MAG: hypothetical protein ABSE06_15190 [Anaerolineaceae bacterium]
MTGITILPFQPEDQAAVKRFVLAGLAERWGKIEFYLNCGFHITHYKDGDVHFTTDPS